MKFNFFLVVAFALLGGCASGTGGEQPVPGSAQKSSASNLATEDKEKKVCKVRPITGSRFKQKTCMTAKEWENMAYETKKMLDKDTRSKPTNY